MAVISSIHRVFRNYVVLAFMEGECNVSFCGEHHLHDQPFLLILIRLVSIHAHV